MKKIKKTFLIVGVSLLILGSTIGIYIASMTCFRSYSQENLSLKTWMKDVKDETKVNEIVIPGSHDAGTYGMSWLGATQHLTIEEQLNLGVRYFDLRVNKVNNDYLIFHSILNGTKFDPILDSIVKFIEDNPSETLLLDFQHFKNGSEEYVYHEVTNKLKNKLVIQDEGMSELSFIDELTLKDARGKCIVFFGGDNNYLDEKHIFSRNNDSSSGVGKALESTYISDYHASSSKDFIDNHLDVYVQKIKDKINKENHKGIFVLQCQLTDKSLILGPYHRERSHEENIASYIENLAKTEYFSLINVIMRDFIDETKTESIIKLNESKGLFN